MLSRIRIFSCVVDPKQQLVDYTKSCFVRESDPLHVSRQPIAQPSHQPCNQKSDNAKFIREGYSRVVEESFSLNRDIVGLREFGQWEDFKVEHHGR
uniref:SFRICE_009246 n=1 Tax=Spodoptera frugiperda TaxID=7108 RepID=A0A2H1VSP9_SPOFR